MPAGKERVSEIVDYSILHGDDETCKTFSIQRTALDRYKRTYREHFGESADLLMKLKKQYTPEELKLLAEGVRPKISKNISYDFSGDTLTLLIMTDTHWGSLYSDESRAYAAFNEAEKEGADTLIHLGDVTEGMSGRPNSVLEMSAIGYKKQRDESIRIQKQWTKKSYYLSGNHDDFLNTKMGAGVAIVEDICKEIPNATYVGQDSGTIELPCGVKIGLFHGNDCASSYALSYRLQRHINGMSPQNKPHVYLTGHDHKAFSMFYRNVHALACGCIQDQTPWMAGKGIQAMPGFYIVKMCVQGPEVKWFQPRFYPFYQ